MVDEIEKYKKEVKKYKRATAILAGAIFVAFILGILVGKWMDNSPPDYCTYNSNDSYCNEPEDIQY